ncbi:Sec-independent protein translocase protein TatB [Vibrio stylophorae]|uniref:Sec-independent protein translocase protein TatB n=1 Tax=Vibrio stylophorae TaxID=659351 RepID=A0ABM8ZQA7_9VIBR|nr:Sec-independent protein translocase protein TatB [Vibrio stylophorae]
MFDIGFWELLLIAIIGLVVLGPQRLPIALHTVARWVGAVRRTIDTVKDELDQELKLEKLRQDLKEAEERGLKNLSPDLQTSLDELKAAAKAVQQPFSDADEAVKRESQAMNDELQSVTRESAPTSVESKSSAVKSESVDSKGERHE